MHALMQTLSKYTDVPTLPPRASGTVGERRTGERKSLPGTVCSLRPGVGGAVLAKAGRSGLPTHPPKAHAGSEWKKREHNTGASYPLSYP